MAPAHRLAAADLARAAERAIRSRCIPRAGAPPQLDR